MSYILIGCFTLYDELWRGASAWGESVFGLSNMSPASYISIAKTSLGYIFTPRLNRQHKYKNEVHIRELKTFHVIPFSCKYSSISEKRTEVNLSLVLKLVKY